MFIKLTQSGGRSYAQLVESFRDETGRPRQRTLATLGRVDQPGGQVDALLRGLLRAKGQPSALARSPQVPDVSPALSPFLPSRFSVSSHVTQLPKYFLQPTDFIYFNRYIFRFIKGVGHERVLNV